MGPGTSQDQTFVGLESLKIIPTIPIVPVL